MSFSIDSSAWGCVCVFVGFFWFVEFSVRVLISVGVFSPLGIYTDRVNFYFCSCFFFSVLDEEGENEMMID